MWPFKKKPGIKWSKIRYFKPNTLVIDTDIPPYRYGLEFIYNPPGRQWRYEGQLVHLVSRHEKTLKALEPPKELGDVLPEKLYRSLNCNEVKIIFALRASFLEKMTTFGLYVLIGGLAFFLFILYGSM